MPNKEKKIIVFTVSDDYDNARNIEKDLWQNKLNVPFDETSIKIAPDPRPGYKGLFYLNISDPSDKLMEEIKPSYITTGKYPQFESYTDQDMKDLIKMMFITQKRDAREIAETLGVTVADVMVWSYYAMY